MTPDQRAAILDLILGRLPEDAFTARSGLHREEPTLVADLLRDAHASKNADDVEHALLLAARWDLISNEHVPALAELLSSDWHTRHEEVARILQPLKDPRAVDALAAAALVRRPEQPDNGDAMARKCTWALADIGTPEARVKLEELASGPLETVAAYAQRRLDNWDDELHRKGHPG